MRPGGVWVLEEATGLLRALPARSWLLWLGGTLPFTWVLIGYLMDMSYSAFSQERIAGQCLLLTLLYVGKHVAQGVFSHDCLQVLRGDRVTAPGAKAVARLALVQSAWQPLRMPALAVSAVALISFPWVAGFLRNVGLSAMERERGFAGEAWRQARGDTRAHSLALVVLTLCWLLLFVNLLVLWFVAPMLLKAFFGVETEFSRLADRLLNATTICVTAVITCAALEPVAGALAAVRAFHDKAREGGEDLRSVLRRMAAMVLVGVLLAAAAGPVLGQDKPLDGSALDRQIDDVLREPEFAWKMSRSAAAPDGEHWLTGVFRAIARWAQWLYDLYKRLFPDSPAGVDAGGSGWKVDPRLLQWAMIGAAALAVGCVVMIVLTRKREARKQAAAPAAVAAEPVDVADENVTAAELAEDAWLRMADELAARGDFRLAMRAVHLAGLRYLGEKGWVTLQPAKTGMEYGRELARRQREAAPVIDGYGQGLRQYERVWYGFGDAEAGGYAALRTRWEEMRRYA